MKIEQMECSETSAYIIQTPAYEDGTDRVFRNVGIYIIQTPAYEDGTDRVFRNVGIYNSDAGELPKRKHNIFRTRRKFEIKMSDILSHILSVFRTRNVEFEWHLGSSPCGPNAPRPYDRPSVPHVLY